MDAYANIKKNASTYLSTHTFVPHAMGDYGTYGLTTFGCDSTIMYKGELWRFIFFTGSNATYVNIRGEELELPVRIQEGIQRMDTA